MQYPTQVAMRPPQKHLQELVRLLASRSPQDIEALLEDLLTPQELSSVAERFQILQALVRGIPQREIAESLHTSIGKITRGSRVVQYGKLDWEKLVTETKK